LRYADSFAGQTMAMEKARAMEPVSNKPLELWALLLTKGDVWMKSGDPRNKAETFRAMEFLNKNGFHAVMGLYDRPPLPLGKEGPESFMEVEGCITYPSS
jgi:hypothetical protein